MNTVKIESRNKLQTDHLTMLMGLKFHQLPGHKLTWTKCTSSGHRRRTDGQLAMAVHAMALHTQLEMLTGIKVFCSDTVLFRSDQRCSPRGSCLSSRPPRGSFSACLALAFCLGDPTALAWLGLELSASASARSHDFWLS